MGLFFGGQVVQEFPDLKEFMWEGDFWEEEYRVRAVGELDRVAVQAYLDSCGE